MRFIWVGGEERYIEFGKPVLYLKIGNKRPMRCYITPLELASLRETGLDFERYYTQIRSTMGDFATIDIKYYGDKDVKK